MTCFQFIADLYSSVGSVEELELTASSTDIKRRKFTYKILDKVFPSRIAERELFLLEIGPGSGYITSEIIEFIRTVKKKPSLDLCDISPTFLDTCCSKFPDIRDCYVRDLCSLGDSPQMPDRLYDIIFFQEALEHTTSPFTAMFNINQMLNTGGLLIVTLPNLVYFRRLLSELLLSTKRNLITLDTHIAELSPVSFVKLASMTGFKVKSTSFYAGRCGIDSPLLSTQVGFICEKVSEPSMQWKVLSQRIVSTWS